MLHYARRDEKPGRKYFTWAPSEEGSIWIDLLTDGNPQYVELQSGRLFNQNMVQSNDTPFKQFLFTPYGTDEWNEYWLPFSGIGGVAKAVGVVAKFGGTIGDYEGVGKVPGPIDTLIAVPTTAGTGSEVTVAAVITDEARNYKLSEILVAK